MRKVIYGLCMMLSYTAANSQAADPFAGNWYRLKSQYRGGNECLESNAATSPDHAGAAFMDKQQNVTGQYWKFEKQPNGYYRIKSQYRGDGECLEGNEAGSQGHAGGAFMSPCQDAGGQYWKVIKDGDYYRLENQFRGSTENLESNRADDPGHSGAAYMDKKQGVTGQLWMLEKVDVSSPINNEEDPVPQQTSIYTKDVETFLACDGMDYKLDKNKLIWQKINGAWVEIGNNCTQLICNRRNVFCKSTDGSLWRYNGQPHNWTPASELLAGQSLNNGTVPGHVHLLISANGKYICYMRRNGDLAVYEQATPLRVLWNSKTANNPNSSLEMQTDGNLVVYDQNHSPTWASTTHSAWDEKYSLEQYKSVRLVLTNDGSLVLYSAPGSEVWNNATGRQYLR